MQLDNFVDISPRKWIGADAEHAGSSPVETGPCCVDLGLTGQRALITGGSRGIGLATANALAAEGVQVAISARDADALAIAVRGLAGGSTKHIGVPIDLMDSGSPARLLELLRAEGFGIPGIVVNNLGGTLGMDDPFAPIAQWKEVMRHNFEIAVELATAVAPAMRKAKWGRIVNVSSLAGLELNGPPAYAAAKAALIAYTRCVGRLLARDGVVMTAVLPGVVRTEGGYWERLETEDPERVRRYLADRCPMGRFGTEEEISAQIAFLCSKHASFAPGAAVTIDGGQLRGYWGG